MIEPILIEEMLIRHYTVWQRPETGPGAEQLTEIWCETENEAIAAACDLAQSDPYADHVLTLVSEETGQHVWESDGDRGEKRMTWQNPLQHREFSPPEDFTGIWHGVEYLQGGRVCPGPRLSDLLAGRSKKQGDTT